MWLIITYKLQYTMIIHKGIASHINIIVDWLY